MTVLTGNKMQTVRLIALISIVLMLSACGRKGAVKPLKANLPDSVQNVELRQRGGELLLSWQLPGQNQNDTPLETAPVVDIYRMLYDPADYCPECKDRSTLLYSIDPELPRPARLNGDRYLLHDRQVAAGEGYRYRLIPRNERGQAGLPLVVQIAFSEPPLAPGGLTIEGYDRSTSLSWNPVQPDKGQKLLGYRIYRQDEESQPAVLLNQRPLTNLGYDDTSLENGRQYRYQIRALFEQNGQSLESLPSATVSAIPQADD